MTSGENLCSTTCPLLSEPPPVQYIHLTSSSLSESYMSFCQQLIISYLQQAPGHCCDRLSGLDISLVTRELPVVYQGSKVSAKTPSTLICVSIETTTGKAGRMLMASQRACDTQQQPFVTEKPSWMNPSLITVSTEWNTRSDATLVSTHALWNHFSLKNYRKVNTMANECTHTYIVDSYPNTWVLRLFITAGAWWARNLSDCLDVIWHEHMMLSEFISAIQTIKCFVLFMGCWKTYGGINLVTVLFNTASPRLGTPQQLEKRSYSSTQQTAVSYLIYSVLNTLQR